MAGGECPLQIRSERSCPPPCPRLGLGLSVCAALPRELMILELCGSSATSPPGITDSLGLALKPPRAQLCWMWHQSPTATGEGLPGASRSPATYQRPQARALPAPQVNPQPASEMQPLLITIDVILTPSAHPALGTPELCRCPSTPHTAPHTALASADAPPSWPTAHP